MITYFAPAPIVGKELRRYFLEHVEPDRRQYVVTKPLHVFKIANTGKHGLVLVNLVIPIGARINAPKKVFTALPEYDRAKRKMRASEAIVRSMHKCNRFHQPLGKCSVAYSGQDSTFVYRPGETVKPKEGFDEQTTVCASGIHFFLNVIDALDYT